MDTHQTQFWWVIFSIEKTTGWASGSKELIAMRKKGIDGKR